MVVMTIEILNTTAPAADRRRCSRSATTITNIDHWSIELGDHTQPRWRRSASRDGNKHARAWSSRRHKTLSDRTTRPRHGIDEANDIPEELHLSTADHHTVGPNTRVRIESAGGSEIDRRQQAIRRWRLWERSTGPRTAAGKARGAQDSLKHGTRSTTGRAVVRSIRELLSMIGD